MTCSTTCSSGVGPTLLEQCAYIESGLTFQRGTCAAAALTSSWPLARQWQRIARIADWRLADWG
eukprot:1480134-Alexandrium_andersonii.AAC.1